MIMDRTGRARPKPGHAFVKLDSKWMDNEGGIIIPDSVKSVPGKTGIVTDYEPYRDQLTQVYEHGKLVTRNMFCYNEIYNGLTGKHVVCDAGQLFSPTGKPEHSLYLVRLESISLIVDDPNLLIEQKEIHYNGVKRCRWCKAGEDNMILDSIGYCPQCNLNEKGEHRKYRDLGECSEDLSYHMNKHIRDEEEHEKLSKKIMTFGASPNSARKVAV